MFKMLNPYSRVMLYLFKIIISSFIICFYIKMPFKINLIPYCTSWTTCLFGQVVSQEKIFRNQPIRNKNCLWWPCLLMDRDEMCKFYKGPSINASYHVSVHSAKGFQRKRLKCEKLTDGRHVMAKAHIAFSEVS